MRTSTSPASIPACPRSGRDPPKLERRAAQAPGLVEPIVKALDAALAALDETRPQLEAALRTADFDPAELERIEERLFALRAAGRKYNVPVDELSALARKYNGDIALIDAGEEKLKALEVAAASRGRLPPPRPRHCRRHAARRAPLSTRLSTANSSRSSWSARNSSPNRRDQAAAGRMASTGRNLGADQSRHAAGTADEGCVRRRAGALPARLEGGAGRPRLGAHACVRRDRHRRGRCRGGCDRHASRQPGRGVRCLPSRTRPRWQLALADIILSPRKRARKASGVATRVTELASERRREEIARMLAGAEITNEARAAAERLMKAAS